MFSVGAAPVQGMVQTMVTSGRGLSAEEITRMILDKILFVADTAPAPIREQALAFRERIETVLLHYVTQAQKSQNTSIYNVLMQAGQHDAAEIVRKL